MSSAPPLPERPAIPEGPFDLAVVGGGINGAGIARDAVLRGKSVALFDKGDFGCGTSSASSKMVHGGIRYLEQLQLGLVHEALRERQRLLRLAPHLVRPQSFVLPVYAGARRGPRWIRLGLWLYDALSLGRRLGRARFLSREEVAAAVPGIRTEGLLGGGLYFDAVMDDARLVLANAISAQEEAAKRSLPFVARNYTAVVRVEPTSPLRLEVEDLTNGRRQHVLADRVVRALGPWSDPELLVPSKGIHVVLPRLPCQHGLLLEHSEDGRVFFVVPWREFSVVGTTETPVAGSPDGLHVEANEVSYLLRELRRAVPGLALGPGDVLGVFAGVRPLARRRSFWPRRGGLAAGRVSRKHRIIEDPSGALTVVGGKYTTYRRIAEEVVDRLFEGTRSSTHRLALPGGEEGPWESFRRRLPAQTVRDRGEADIERLWGRYGSRLREVLRLVEDDRALGEPVAPGYAAIRAEVVYAARRELAVYAADFLDRRTSLRHAPDGGRAAYDAVAFLLEEHRGFRVRAAQLESARRLWFEARTGEDVLRSLAVSPA
jgi:glycerol-3-phosphate dehydrogenase